MKQNCRFYKSLARSTSQRDALGLPRVAPGSYPPPLLSSKISGNGKGWMWLSGSRSLALRASPMLQEDSFHKQTAISLMVYEAYKTILVL